MRVAIYVRISQDRDDERQGIKRQLDDCWDLARKAGHEVVEVLEDNDRSAYSRKPREGWNRVMELAESGAIDAVVAWRFDRIYRRPIELEQVIERAHEVRLRLELYNGMSLDLGDPGGQMIARNLVAMAHAEMAFKSERTRRKFEQLAKDGKFKGGRRPLGFEADGVTVREVEAAALREAARMIVAGSTLKEATLHVRDAVKAARLPEDKIRTKRDRDGNPAEVEVSPRGLRDILLSDRVIGIRAYTPTNEQRAFEARRARGEVRGRAEPAIRVKAEWPAILSPDLQKEVRAELTARNTHSGRRPQKSLLSGLIFCGECGHKLGYSRTAYTCPPELNGGCGGKRDQNGNRVGGVGVNVDPIETLVVDAVAKRLQRIRNREVSGFSEADEQLPRSEWEVLEQKRHEINESREIGLLTYEEAKEKWAVVKKQLDALDAKQAQLRAEAQRRRHALGTIDDWETLPPTQQAQVIRTVVRHIVLLKAKKRGGPGLDLDRVQIHWMDGHCDCTIQKPPDYDTFRVIRTAARANAVQPERPVSRKQGVRNRVPRRGKYTGA